MIMQRYHTQTGFGYLTYILLVLAAIGAFMVGTALTTQRNISASENVGDNVETLSFINQVMADAARCQQNQANQGTASQGCAGFDNTPRCPSGNTCDLEALQCASGTRLYGRGNNTLGLTFPKRPASLDMAQFQCSPNTYARFVVRSTKDLKEVYNRLRPGNATEFCQLLTTMQGSARDGGAAARFIANLKEQKLVTKYTLARYLRGTSCEALIGGCKLPAVTISEAPPLSVIKAARTFLYEHLRRDPFPIYLCMNSAGQERRIEIYARLPQNTNLICLDN